MNLCIQEFSISVIVLICGSVTDHWYPIERILLFFVTKNTISQAGTTQSGEHNCSQSANVVGT